MPATPAMGPSRAASKLAAPARGRRRTRLPRRTSAAPIRMAAGAARFRSLSRRIGSASRDDAWVAQDAVQPHDVLDGQSGAALDDLPRAGIARHGLAPFVVGEAQHVEHEHLVDLGGVEEIARAL